MVSGPTNLMRHRAPNILAISDDGVPSTVKDRILQSPGGYISTTSPAYNANLPVIIIPFQFETEFPWNTEVINDTIRANFFKEAMVA